MIPAKARPDPYLQLDSREDCGYYAAAYVARCLGYLETTAERVKAWCAETRFHETAYAREVLGAEMRTFWDVFEDEPRRKWFWLGPGLHGWVNGWLFAGWIAQVCVHRIPEMGHAVVLLGCSSDGVLLMDPLSGFVTEPWEWFLGIGPGTYGCHFIEGWYRPAGSTAEDEAAWNRCRDVVSAKRVMP